METCTLCNKKRKDVNKCKCDKVVCERCTKGICSICKNYAGTKCNICGIHVCLEHAKLFWVCKSCKCSTCKDCNNVLFRQCTCGSIVGCGKCGCCGLALQNECNDNNMGDVAAAEALCTIKMRIDLLNEQYGWCKYHETCNEPDQVETQT